MEKVNAFIQHSFVHSINQPWRALCVSGVMVMNNPWSQEAPDYMCQCIRKQFNQASVTVEGKKKKILFFNVFHLFILFLFFNFTILYWFCHISTWIRHRYTCVPHLEPSSLPVPSLWVIPVHQPQASSIVHRTWTGDLFHIWCYTCFNAILPNHSPSPSPTESKGLFYTSVSLLLSRIQDYRYHLSKFHIYALVYCTGERQWHPTPVLLPGNSHGRRSLVGCSPWGR